MCKCTYINISLHGTNVLLRFCTSFTLSFFWRLSFNLLIVPCCKLLQEIILSCCMWEHLHSLLNKHTFFIVLLFLSLNLINLTLFKKQWNEFLFIWVLNFPRIFSSHSISFFCFLCISILFSSFISLSLSISYCLI